MATYIKTLKEDNGDITYPQTTADAVLNANSSTQGGTVQAFLDQAVIAEEIASTGTLAQTVPASIIDWSSMPIRHTVASFANISGEIYVALTRYGNLVVAYLNVVLTSGSSQYDEQNSGVCPSGYRPIYDSMIVGNMSAGGSTNGTFDFTIVAGTGQVKVSSTSVSARTRVQGVGVWWTNDAMPSS